jgi:8-amino-7-oxononanoate synthase
MADPLAWLTDELHAWEARGLRRRLHERIGPQLGSEVNYEGRAYINFGSNDYLGLAAAPELTAAVAEQLETVGWGAGASPLVTGRGTLHAQLERELARFEGTEAALLFPTGYAANVGAITALVGREDAIFSDAKNHASIIDSCRLSGARLFVYPHNDVDALAKLLAEHAARARRRLIVTDSLFSMDGDFASLPALAQLAEQHDAMLLVDEAHATGVFGHHGRGVSELQDCEAGVHVRVGTLSKALGSHGGFVAGSQMLIDWLANRARPYVFSTAAPEALAAAGLAAIAMVREQPERRTKLLQNAAMLRTKLRSLGLDVGTSQSQIIPVILGDPERTMQASQRLREQGLWVPGIRPPSVPPGESLLRISLSAAHTDQMIERLIEGLRGLQ